MKGNNPFNLRNLSLRLSFLSLILSFIFNLHLNCFSSLRALHCKDSRRVIVDHGVYLLYSFKVQILTYFQSWVAEMNEDDNKPEFLKTGTLHEGQDNLPPIRCSSSCLPAFQVSPIF